MKTQFRHFRSLRHSRESGNPGRTHQLFKALPTVCLLDSRLRGNDDAL